MTEYKRPATEQEFDQNFAQKKPLMNETEAYYESSRCLFCYDAPCINACPTGIDIPLFIKQIHTANLTGAAVTIYDANWLGNTCGKVCPTGVLCEGACVYNHQDISPVQIGRLQNFATANAIQDQELLFMAGPENNRMIAVIGAGPSGVSCACELRKLGYSVDVFEAKARPSGLAVHGTAPYKITNEEVLDEVDYLQAQLQFSINYNHPIETTQQVVELESNYEAIFLGVGLGPTAGIKIPGEEQEHVIGAVEFIETLRLKQHKVKVPDRVIVIGGGNTAMDAASECARMGAKEVTLAYRRAKKDMGGYDFEYDLAVSSGVNGMFNVQPVEITGNGKIAAGVKFMRTSSEGGRLEYIKGSEHIVSCDMVIKATGQSKLEGFLSKIKELELDERNCIKVDTASLQTTNPMYFAGGDASNGGAEVVNAVHEGKKAAMGIHKWLNK